MLKQSIAVALTFFWLGQAFSAEVDAKLPDGFYTASNAPANLKVTGAKLNALDNLNTRFWLSVSTPDDGRELPGLWLKIGESKIPCVSRGSNQGKNRSYGFGGVDQLVLKQVTKLLGIEPQLREHPGYQLAVNFQPAKHEFAAGEDVVATLVIKNVGSIPFSFMDGGRNRGARNNQFSITCFRSGKAVRDTGDSRHFGGLAGRKTVKPGEVFTKQVSLQKWFKCDQPGFYTLVGSYYFEAVPNDDSMRTIWTDYATGEFGFTVKE